MKGTTYIRLASLFLTVFFALPVWAQSGESISSFEANMDIQSDGTVLVTETITYDFGDNQRHGIYRTISEKHAQDASSKYKERYVDIELLAVERNGHAEPYLLQDYPGLSVRIGDADATISGEQIYTIRYELQGALSVLPNANELYWNVTGDEWEVPMEQVEVRVSGAGVTQADQIYCYAGFRDEQASCDEARIEGDETIFSQDDLRPGQQLTIATIVTTVSAPVVLERINSVLLVLFAMGLSLLLTIGFLAYVLVWKRGHKPKNDTVIAQYEPYQALPPMFIGLLIDGMVNQYDITAGVVKLAQSGFIKIKHVKKKVLAFFESDDYEITLLQSPAEVKDPFRREVLSLLFDTAHDQSGAVVSLSTLKTNTTKQTENMVILQQLHKLGNSTLLEQGYFEKRGAIFQKGMGKYVLGLLLVIVAAVVLLPFSIGLTVVSVFLILELLLLALILPHIRRRTAKGYEAMLHIRGFKDFLKTTDAERFKFHNAPTLNAETYMEFLPYAIALNVEKEWAKVFKEITIEAPAWYSDATTSVHVFSVASFSKELSSFSTSFSAASHVASGGSSGGGSAGGGGGGGGGGSW